MKKIKLKCVKMLKKLPSGDCFMVGKEYEVDNYGYIWSECEKSYRREWDAIIHKYYKFERVD